MRTWREVRNFGWHRFRPWSAIWVALLVYWFVKDVCELFSFTVKVLTAPWDVYPYFTYDVVRQLDSKSRPSFTEIHSRLESLLRSVKKTKRASSFRGIAFNKCFYENKIVI